MGKKARRRINLFLNRITLPYVFVAHFWIAFCILLGSKNGGPVPDWAAYILIILMVLECFLVVRTLWIINKRSSKWKNYF